jgi:hypothetical protein
MSFSFQKTDKKPQAKFSPVVKSVKTPKEVKKENQEKPTTHEKRMIEKIETEQANFETLILKPKTRHNKIQLLKSQIKLYYYIEKLPLMNKSKVKKLSVIIKKLDKNNNLNNLIKIERRLN